MNEMEVKLIHFVLDVDFGREGALGNNSHAP